MHGEYCWMMLCVHALTLTQVHSNHFQIYKQKNASNHRFLSNKCITTHNFMYFNFRFVLLFLHFFLFLLFRVPIRCSYSNFVGISMHHSALVEKNRIIYLFAFGLTITAHRGANRLNGVVPHQIASTFPIFESLFFILFLGAKRFRCHSLMCDI